MQYIDTSDQGKILENNAESSVFFSIVYAMEKKI
jgi:hypothetical protein